jgi:hypothetical protein
MTTQAEKIYVINLQHARIGRAMRRVTRQAALICLHRRVLKDEGPHGVGVALGTDCKLASRRADLMTYLRAVRVMTVAALYESNLDAMAIGTREFSLLRSMTAEAEFSLRLHQHEIHISRLVGTMAGRATDAAGKMSGLGEVLCLETRLVTRSAYGGSLRRT